MLTKLAECGVYLKKSELKSFVKLVDKYSKETKTFDGLDAASTAKKEKDEKDENQISMNTKSLIGCVTIFCGVLLCILPFPQIRAIGAGLIAEGTRKVIMGYAEENDQKKNLKVYL